MRHAPRVRSLAAVLAVFVCFLIPASAACRRALVSRYVRARIAGQVKCLGRGEYCAVSERSQYPKYGFRCVDVDGTYRLEPKS